MVTIRNQRGTVELSTCPRSNAGGQSIADDTNDACQCQKMIRGLLIDQLVDSRNRSDDPAHCDGEYDRPSRELFCSRRPEQEGKSDRERSECVSDVVDQIGQKGDAAAGDEDERLGNRRCGQDREGKAYRSQSTSRPERSVPESNGVADPRDHMSQCGT